MNNFPFQISFNIYNTHNPHDCQYFNQTGRRRRAIGEIFENWKNDQNKGLIMEWFCPLQQIQTSKFKLETSTPNLELLLENACIFIENAHPSYAHIILQMSLSHSVKFEP